VRVEPLEGDRDGIGAEALELELAALAAIHRVGVLRPEGRDVEVLRAGADLFIRRERDPDRAVRISVCSCRYSAAAMISATPALLSAPSRVGAGGRGDVVTDALGEIRPVGRPEHGRRIIRQHDVASRGARSRSASAPRPGVTACGLVFYSG
jgi:hypothetical protein